MDGARRIQRRRKIKGGQCPRTHSGSKGHSQQRHTHQEVKQLLLLLLCHFSRVRLCATPETAAHQAPLSLAFSRQEHWSGLPFPECIKVKSESEVPQSCLTLSDPMDCSLQGFSTHGILQARIMEWGAIAFSEIKQKRMEKSYLD